MIPAWCIPKKTTEATATKKGENPVKKKNVLNDGVEDAEKQQDLDETLRMPTGVKKPKKTQK
ncbi:hypothetical protein SDC9_69353 [bioreactor metagenome]|uniref:Uncharacterized protein n=1 Tax=bioreactor metagenome TaxID=1076179 RepID=A0A644Y8J2_9ZZZZ